MHRLWRSLCALSGQHAEYEDLLAYKDQELGRTGQWCVGIHLRDCKACQQQAEFMEEDVRAFKELDYRFYPSNLLDLPKGLSKLRLAIEDWEAHNVLVGKVLESGQTLDETGLRQLATDFSFYLGNGATAALLVKMKNGERNHRNVLAEAESVLSNFLGPGAAAAATQRILYVQMVRHRSIQGSPAP